MKAKVLVSFLNELINNNENLTEFSDVINRMKIIPQLHQVAARDELSFLIHNYQMDGRLAISLFLKSIILLATIIFLES